MDTEEPVQLSQEALDAFKAIYRQEFRRDISNEQAQEMGCRLLRLFILLAQEIPPSHLQPV